MFDKNRLFVSLEAKQFLGDGLYVGHDGHHVWLVAHNGDSATDAVALDVDALRNFLDWKDANLKPEKVDD